MPKSKSSNRTSGRTSKRIPAVELVSIPSRREIHSAIKTEHTLSFDKLISKLSLSARQATAMRYRLDAMVRDGQLCIAKKSGDYRAAGKLNMAEGVINQKRNMVFDDGGKELRLYARFMHGVLPGDKVCALLDHADDILSLDITHRDCELAGVFREPAQVVPLRDAGIPHIHVSVPKRLSVKDGDTVRVRMRTPSDRRATPTGEVAKVIGGRGSGDPEAEIIMCDMGIPNEWPEKVPAEVRRLRYEDARRCVTRTDMCDLCFVTIDGATAKDFDDAIYCEKDSKGWTVRVAIADVASYVRPGGALDTEASRRGNSVYFPRAVVPMLPETLSNGDCSLKPDVARLALVCTMRMTASGTLKDYQFEAAVIRSKARLTYTQVGRFFQTDRLPDVPSEVKTMLRNAYDVFLCLRKKREARGALEITSSESMLFFNERGRVSDIAPVKHNDAHRLIEEFMVNANVCAAQYLIEKKHPFLSRVHTGYKEGGFEALKSLLRERGIRLTDAGHKPLAKALSGVGDADMRFMFEQMLLRNIARAEYRPQAWGHFGLGLKHYAHFTSPIRRYPDLLLHRAIHATLGSRAGVRYESAQLTSLGGHCSMTEKRADDATRDLQRYYECLFMSGKIGETFSGRVVGVTSFGIFVNLDKYAVDGLVHITALPQDYYEYDPVAMTLVGEASGKRYAIGGRLKVTVVRADPQARQVDFEIENVTPRSRRRAGSRGKRSR